MVYEFHHFSGGFLDYGSVTSHISSSSGSCSFPIGTKLFPSFSLGFGLLLFSFDEYCKIFMLIRSSFLSLPFQSIFFPFRGGFGSYFVLSVLSISSNNFDCNTPRRNVFVVLVGLSFWLFFSAMILLDISFIGSLSADYFRILCSPLQTASQYNFLFLGS